MEDRNLLEKLPDDLLGDVFAQLMGREAAQLTILSKTWRNVWKSGYHLVFDQRIYRKCDAERYVELVKSTIARYQILKSRKDSVTVFTKIPSIASEIIKTFAVKNFSLDFLVPSESFVIPIEFLESKILMRVRLTCCVIGWKINWRQLHYLRLCHALVIIRFEGDIVSYICGSCPLLVDLELSDCTLCNDGDSVFNSAVDRFDRLKSLLLEKMELSGSFFTDFSSKFPCLEDLTIRHCAFLEVETEIDSHSLKNLILEHNKCVKAVFDVPGIKNFNFEGKVVPQLSLKPVAGPWKSHITINWNEFQNVWFQQLHALLGTTLSQSTISLALVLGQIAGKKKNKMIPAKAFLTKPVLFETLEIGVGSSPSSNAMDALFCNLHPQFIYQRWMPSPPLLKATVEESIKFRELICRTLMPEGYEDRLRGLHDLVGVEVEKRKDSRGDFESLPKNMISDAMAQVLDANIRFKLQWEGRTEGGSAISFSIHDLVGVEVEKRKDSRGDFESVP